MISNWPTIGSWRSSPQELIRPENELVVPRKNTGLPKNSTQVSSFITPEKVAVIIGGSALSLLALGSDSFPLIKSISTFALALLGITQIAQNNSLKSAKNITCLGLIILATTPTLSANDCSPSLCLSQTGKFLPKKVENILQNGGKLEPIPSSSGLYFIKDLNGQPQAIFKPDDERNWGPQNRNPKHRLPAPSSDNISFHQLSSFLQGKTDERQALAKLFDFGSVSCIPEGAVMKLESTVFVDLEPGAQPKKQIKQGYVQEWVSHAKSLVDFHPIAQAYIAAHPDATAYPQEAYRFEDNPMLDKVPIEEFQKIGVLDILLYNEDRHPGNILIVKDIKDQYHMVPIDMDAILPWQLKALVGLYTHPRAEKPFTPEILRIIADIDPEHIAEMVKGTELPHQAATNAKALAIVLKHFSAAGFTLADIYRFVSKPYPADQNGTSKLWQVMTEAKQAAVKRLPPQDQAKFAHREHLKWTLWWDNGKQAPPDAKQWLNGYNKEFKNKIESQIESDFWKIFIEKINSNKKL